MRLSLRKTVELNWWYIVFILSYLIFCYYFVSANREKYLKKLKMSCLFQYKYFRLRLISEISEKSFFWLDMCVSPSAAILCIWKIFSHILLHHLHYEYFFQNYSLQRIKKNILLRQQKNEILKYKTLKWNNTNNRQKDSSIHY